MKRYVENVYEHDSEIMLNWKDIKLVLEEIERLNKRIDKAIEFIERKMEYYYEEDIDNLLDILKGSDKNE